MTTKHKTYNSKETKNYPAISILLTEALNAVLLVNDCTSASKLSKCSAP